MQDTGEFDYYGGVKLPKGNYDNVSQSPHFKAMKQVVDNIVQKIAEMETRINAIKTPVVRDINTITKKEGGKKHE